MKKRIFNLVTIVMAFTFCASQCSEEKPALSPESLESGFVTPPDSIQTSVYWYWISDHLSKEGVVKDLHAMKEVGINRAFIGNIGINNLPFGKVKIWSDEWWDVLHAALKTATELNIEIGIFNSPGWSQSGGPWIKPEQSMRYLTSSKTTVKGPQKISIPLPKPEGFFQDVKVIAYPVTTGNQNSLTVQNTAISSSPSITELAKIIDKNNTTGINIPESGEFSIFFDTKEPFTARSLSVQVTERPVSTQAILQAKGADGKFKTISEFTIDRSNIDLNVGFKPFAPVVISIPSISSTGYKLTFKNSSAPVHLAEVEISSSPRVERYAEKTLAKMHQTPLPYWNAYLWPSHLEGDEANLAIKSGEVKDITQNMSADGVLTWNVPEGEWTVLRTGMAPTQVTNAPASPEATGLEVDKMSKKWVAEHFDRFIGEILRKIPEADRKTFKVVVQDSYETGGQNFTDDFLAAFENKYGYNPVPYLPVYEGLVVDSQLASDRFLWDMRRLVADKVAYDYVGGLRDISHKHGLKTWLENYGHWGFPGEFLMYGGQSDEIGGEFWSAGDLGNIENRAATSAGHIYGKKKISAESNTSGGPAYSRYPAMMKQRTDRFFAEGINNTLLHLYIHQPYEDKNPGVNAEFGNEFNRKNTWFSQLDVFIQYLKRTNLMLQQGLNVADVAYFIGEDAPKMTGVTDPPLPVGYQFDYMNAEVILRDMKVKDGLLTLPHGTQYKILVLPKLETMRPEVLEKIKKLVYEGAVVLGPAPTRSPSLQNQPQADEQVNKLAKELWAEADGEKVKYRQYGKGYIMNGLSLEEAFEIISCIPDCKLPEDHSIHYGHRTMPGIDIYFLSNQTDEEKIIYPEFRITGKQPELWDATTGSIRDLPAYEQKGQSTAVPLKLAANESAFIVFRRSAASPVSGNIVDNYPDPKVITELKGPWNVTFDTAKRGPSEPVAFETLYDWGTSSEKRIKYYSGSADYRIQFDLPQKQPDQRILIDLGNLTAMAKVFVNGAYAGGVWTPPYRLDITEQVKTGTNELKITVVNTWTNRMIGDLNLPEAERETWSLVNQYNSQSPLQPSGLFGPVTINKINRMGVFKENNN